MREAAPQKKKRKPGIPTGNAGEYFVMGELLRRGYDAQLADRNTKGYDILVGRPEKPLRRIQVKTVRAPPWYVRTTSFEGYLLNQVTIYVLLGKEDARAAVRYFVTKNRHLASKIHKPAGWKEQAFMPLKAVEKYEDNWNTL